MGKALEYFQLSKVTVQETEPGEFRLVNAAVLSCSLCGRMIDGMGGPGEGAICLPCGEALENGGLVGCVLWEGE